MGNKSTVPVRPMANRPMTLVHREIMAQRERLTQFLQSKEVVSACEAMSYRLPFKFGCLVQVLLSL